MLGENTYKIAQYCAWEPERSFISTFILTLFFAWFWYPETEMSYFANKTHVLLFAFADYVQRLSSKHKTSSPSTPELFSPSNTDTRNEETDCILGIQNSLLNIMDRIYTLHVRTKEQGILKSESVLIAVTIWKDLDDSKNEAPEYFAEGLSLQESSISALFVWLYLIVHPEGIRDEKVQTAVQSGLAGTADISAAELLPFVLIPAFYLGLAALEHEQRDKVNTLFCKLEAIVMPIDVRLYREIVEQSWQKLDRGANKSWDWSE
jgi:hypothetical protein